ncbi:MAG: deoxyribodipyrimidine photolyase, partial [Myxococcota bacterium]
MVPEERIRTLLEAPLRPDGDYVLYWMTAFRRTRSNFSLDRALEYCRELDRPLLIFEPLRVGYEWASDRIHRFVIDGMADNFAATERAGVTYFPWVERREGEGKGLLAAFAERAAVVIADDYPAFFLPRMVAAAAKQLDGVRLEAVDSNGLYPLRATDKTFNRAVDFRRHLQKSLAPHLGERPAIDPLAEYDLGAAPIPSAVSEGWTRANDELLSGKDDLSEYPIDHAVTVAKGLPGGQRAAYERLQGFIDERLSGYGEGRNHPDDDSASGLSPYLHFGHISTHQIFEALVRREDWNPSRLGTTAR